MTHYGTEDDVWIFATINPVQGYNVQCVKAGKQLASFKKVRWNEKGELKR